MFMSCVPSFWLIVAFDLQCCFDYCLNVDLFYLFNKFIIDLAFVDRETGVEDDHENEKKKATKNKMEKQNASVSWSRCCLIEEKSEID